MVKDRSRRRLLQLLGATTTASLSGCVSIFGQQKSTEPTPTRNQSTTTAIEIPTTTPAQKRKISAPSGIIGTVSVPASPSKFTYPRMGSADAPITATIYGSWKCPYTQEFVQNALQTIITKFVQPGKLSLAFREVAYRDGEPFHGPDELIAGYAGLAIWNHAPKSYWPYFATVFANQQAGTESWATPDRLLKLAKAAGVPHRTQVRREIKQSAYQSELKQTMKRVSDLGLGAVPRVVVNDSVTTPTVDSKSTMTQIKTALTNAK